MLSIGGLAEGLRPSDDMRNVRVSAKAVHRLRKKLTALSLEERLAVPNLDPRRADLAPAGAVLVDTLLDGLGAEEVTLCDFALREGLIIDYIKRNAAHIRTVDRYPDVRRRSVIELGERCNYYPAHAQQVARISLALFDGTRRRHGLGPREREWLEYAALLHDVGTHIGYERHHKHSYYLIRHGGLRGFAPEEVEIIGLVARYHRQATPKRSHEEFAVLPSRARQTVKLLSALVRLAEGLDRSHGQVIKRVRASLSARALTVRLTAAADAELELWAASRHAEALGSVLGTEVVFDLTSTARRRNAKGRAGQRRRQPPVSARRRRKRAA
jgi:exopolyphosphatase/guanosine-5'-triphosphate,3'-diphosphate pyrophosphatase